MWRWVGGCVGAWVRGAWGGFLLVFKATETGMGKLLQAAAHLLCSLRLSPSQAFLPSLLSGLHLEALVHGNIIAPQCAC